MPRRNLYIRNGYATKGVEKMTDRILLERTLFLSQREKCREIDKRGCRAPGRTLGAKCHSVWHGAIPVAESLQLMLTETIDDEQAKALADGFEVLITVMTLGAPEGAH